MTITILNDRGEEVSRQIVGVGAIEPGEQRKFTFSVDVFTPGEPADVEPGGTNLVDVAARKR